ncbi:dihydrodipicolinate reductase [Oceaniglobus indicus]|uniref:dihydrodipicolinate reductase n=1 Tax=Oceaniglobus indicus TaxID=2047749 RepID=UPI000C19A259|nr:dihydrodipicolinate reductase [Oceaniglobus indicus]
MTATRLSLAAACLAVAWGAPVAAQQFRAVTDKSDFVNLINGRELTRFGIRLSVSPGGAITGTAFTADVTGSWTWSGDYFCRSLKYGNKQLADNCQTVAVSGATIRFTADRGAGDTADLTIR